DPAMYYRNNLGGTLSLLAAMRQTGVDKIVFSSTCATYGDPDSVPIRESARQLPGNPYGETKLAIERALHWFDQAHGLRSVWLRCDISTPPAPIRTERSANSTSRKPIWSRLSCKPPWDCGRKSISTGRITRPRTEPRSGTTSMSKILRRHICPHLSISLPEAR